MGCPLDYGLCRQCVTVYRLEGEQVLRQELAGVSLQYSHQQICTAQGMEHTRPFRLIVPGDRSVQVGDRVYDGIGPQITVRQWNSFVPSEVEGLCQISRITPFYWQGSLCHREAC